MFVVVHSNLVENMLEVFLDNSYLVVLVDSMFVAGKFLGLMVAFVERALVFVELVVVSVFLETLVASGLLVLRVYFVLLGLA